MELFVHNSEIPGYLLSKSHLLRSVVFHSDISRFKYEDIFKFYKSCAGYSKVELEELGVVNKCYNRGHLYREGEAKDLTCDLSQYSIHIEEKEIDF